MKKVIEIVMVIIGTLIGAGFASGREIYLFFLKFGKAGIVGIITSSILTGIIIYKTLKIIKEKNIKNYNDFLENINLKNIKINFFIKNIVTVFLLISFYIMVAGFGAYIKQLYDIPIYISTIIFVMICYLFFRKSLKGMIKINKILIPFLLFFILYLGIKNVPYLMESKMLFIENTQSKGWFINSILYTSYNSIILIPVLVTMNKYLIDNKQIKNIAIISVIIIIILSFSIFTLLLKGIFFIEELELPLIQISIGFGKIFSYIYGFVIIASIITSAISVGYSFLENVSKDIKEYNRNLILICISSVFISNIGFSKLVELLYPLFGLLGIVQIIFILRKK